MPESSLAEAFFLIFTGSALLATVALFARQTLILAYVLIGIALGPSTFNLIEDPQVISQMSNIGIMFLLFLMGVDLPPSKLKKLPASSLLITALSSLIFVLLGYSFGIAIGLSHVESVMLGASVMFSSTIISIKLLPTTVLHHRETGENIIRILLLQDFAAIFVLVALNVYDKNASAGVEQNLATLLLALPLLAIVAYVAEKFVLLPLLKKFDCIKEYIFLLAIGWCLGMAQLSASLGISEEIGAFIAGVALASSPISFYITESLKPLRDFFLIIFFFSLGASINIGEIQDVLIPALVLGIGITLLKPGFFQILGTSMGMEKPRAREIGFRLGQGSEFSLLIAALALDGTLISHSTAQLIQLGVLISFILSSYIVVLNYPSPVALSEKLRRD